MNQLTKLNISHRSIDKWLPFFKGWALYCHSPSTRSGARLCTHGSDNLNESTSISSSAGIEKGKPLGSLTSACYLYHYNEFESLYKQGQFQPNSSENGNRSDSPTFRGTIVLVGSRKEPLLVLANSISNELACSKVAKDINDMTDNNMLLSMQQSGGGMLCTAEIRDGTSKLRKLAKTYGDILYIVMVGCSEEELEAAFVNLELLDVDLDKGESSNVSKGGHKELQKIKGMTKAWRKSKCKLLLELPKGAIGLDENATISFLRSDRTASTVLKKLQDSSQSFKSDDRPGLVVFFPVIPRSGKSSLCRDITPKALGIENDRKLIVREGDRVKKKFYTVVEKEILDAPACITVLDKNVPPPSWNSIRKICATSRSFIAAVVPPDMEDTLIGSNLSSHTYPFSLEYLAVCMSRVLNRQPNTHSGKLDSATELACMIVVKFSCFYRNYTNARMVEKITALGESSSSQISVSFFKEGTIPELPNEFKIALEDAVNLQTCEDLKIGEVNTEQMNDMEGRLRTCVGKYQHVLDDFTAPLDHSREVFRAHLSIAISTLDDKFEAMPVGNKKKIKIVSLDFTFDAVYSIVNGAANISSGPRDT